MLFYYKLHAAEQPIGFSSSAGLAFHTSRHSAILHALYEVIERDGINVHWYSKLPPPRVDVDMVDFLADFCNIRSARMSTPYLAQGVQIFLHTLDIPIPVLTAMVIDRSRQERAFQGGSGASSQRESALAQALFEIGQSQTGFSFDDPFGRPPVYADTDISKLTEFFDAPLYFGHASNLPRLSWYATSEQVVPWETIQPSALRMRQRSMRQQWTGYRRLGSDPLYLTLTVRAGRAYQLPRCSCLNSPKPVRPLRILSWATRASMSCRSRSEGLIECSGSMISTLILSPSLELSGPLLPVKKTKESDQ